MKKVYRILIGLLVLTMAFTACAPAAVEEPAEVEVVEEPAEAEVVEEEAAEKFIIGFGVPVLANPFWKANADFAENMATDLGMDYLIGDANSQEDQQVKAIEDLIAQGVDGLILAPVSQAVGPKLLELAEEAGVLVVFAERNPGFKPDEYDGDIYVGFVGVDNKAGGRLGAEALAEAGVTKALAIAGAQGNSVVEARVEGFKEVAAEKGIEVLQIEYGQELREDGLKTMENFLAAFPAGEFDGVWCFNDDTALGVIEALRQADALEGVSVTGLDATEPGVAAIMAGEMLAAPGGQFIDGGLAAIMLFDALNGNMPKTAWVEMDFLNVVASNAEEYSAQYIEGLPPYDAKEFSATFNSDASTDDYSIIVN